ncbi:MAG: protease-4, partial [Hyphomonas sp.]
RLTYYPRRKTGFEALESLFGVSEETARVAYMLGTVANNDRVQILIEDLATADSVNSGQMLAVGPRMREQ